MAPSSALSMQLPGTMNMHLNTLNPAFQYPPDIFQMIVRGTLHSLETC
jgi:hypothetical protein